MDISQVGLIGSGLEERSRAEEGAIGLADNFDNFLQLLTQQLQNQDPMEPLNSTDFTNQLVQFANVEQAVNQNLTLEKLLEVQQASQAVSATGFLGAEVEVFGKELDFRGEPAAFKYQLAGPSEETIVNIRDDTGKIVRTLGGATDAGEHDLVWDGLNSQGIQAKDGVYEIEVLARDKAGESIDTATTVTGIVSGVAAQDGTVVLRIGDASYSVDKVVSVTAPTESTTTNA